MKTVARYLPALLALLAMLAVWEAATRILAVNALILPAPSRIALAGYELREVLLGHLWTTTYEIVAGFLIGNAAAVLIAFVIVHSATADRILHPLLLASQTVPKLAIAPLLVIWFGTDLLTKVIVTALVCFFPTAINVVQGLRSADPNALDLVRLATRSRRAAFCKVQFPSAIPYFFAGLKISMAAAVIGAVVAEWVGATHGLGYLILYGGQSMRTDVMFVGVVAVVALGMVLYAAVGLAERKLSWNAPR